MNDAILNITNYIQSCVEFWACDPVFTGLLVLSFFESFGLTLFYNITLKKEKERKEKEREEKRKQNGACRKNPCSY